MVGVISKLLIAKYLLAVIKPIHGHFPKPVLPIIIMLGHPSIYCTKNYLGCEGGKNHGKNVVHWPRQLGLCAGDFYLFGDPV